MRLKARRPRQGVPREWSVASRSSSVRDLQVRVVPARVRRLAGRESSAEAHIPRARRAQGFRHVQDWVVSVQEFRLRVQVDLRDAPAHRLGAQDNVISKVRKKDR